LLRYASFSDHSCIYMNEHQLYVKLYPEMLARSQSVGTFVKKVWELVGGGKQLGVAYDQVSYST